MPSHMSSIGFPVQTVSDFTSLARQAVQAGQAFEVAGLGGIGDGHPERESSSGHRSMNKTNSSD